MPEERSYMLEERSYMLEERGYIEEKKTNVCHAARLQCRMGNARTSLGPKLKAGLVWVKQK
jgi:hypothetical protein